ncbi:MAG TPA: hypothetical protein EYG01_01090 [Flavobacteriales bacterium]|nr:hypothetical protein [Flavobacteriales bacterium]
MSKKSIIHHFISIFALIAVLLIYFYPTIQGKILVQDDITRSIATSKEARDFRADTGEEALWTNSQFGGMPTFQMNTEYPSNLMRYFEKGLKFYRILPDKTGLIFMLLLGFYFLLITLGVDKKISVIGAIAFGFSTFFIISLGVGHNSKLRSIGYIAPIIAGVLMTYKGKKLLGGAITAFTLALAINANHFQITYYLFLLLLVLASVYLFQAIQKKNTKDFFISSAILLLSALLSVGPNVSKLWTTYSYSGETMRGGKSELTVHKEKSKGGLDIDYALKWSYGKMESLNLLMPNFYGGSSTKELNTSSNTYKKLVKNGVNKRQAKKYIERMPIYWGEQQFTSGPTYLGAIILFLFLIGTFIIRGPTKWWIVIGSVLALMIAWGSNLMWFNQLMFEYFPMFNKFRAPSMALTIVCFTAPLLAMLALNKMLTTENISKYWDKIKLSFYILGGLCLLFYLFGGSLFSFEGLSDDSLKQQGWPIDAIVSDRVNLLKSSAIRSLLLISLVFGLIWSYSKQKLSANLFIGIVGFLILADIWIVDKEYLGADNFHKASAKEKSYLPSVADQQILKDNDPNFRVFNLSVNPFTDALTSYHHKSVGGYHGAKLIRYQDMIDKHLSKQNMQVINMLNTKYLITQNKKTGQKQAQLNRTALGNAWFVNKILWAENADNEIDLLGDFNATNEVVIDSRYKDYFTKEIEINSSTINLINYKPNHLTYKANVNNEHAFAVLSEIYYEGSGNDWQAYIDDNPVEHIRVNYLLRGMNIPNGEHIIEFKFSPPSYFIGEKISLVFSILVILLFFGALAVEFKPNRS